MSVFDEARKLFAENGLGSPPVPPGLRQHLKKISPWCYATRPMDPMEMYFFNSYIIELLTSSVDDYVSFSHAGHGINSYAISYHLVQGELAIIAQVGWGGGYSDRQSDARAVRALFARCRRLLRAYGLSSRKGTKPGQRRLIVIESEMRGAFACAWLTDRLSVSEAKGWLHEQYSMSRGPDPVPLNRRPTVIALNLLEATPSRS